MSDFGDCEGLTSNGVKTAANLFQVVPLQQRPHERARPLLRRLGAILKQSVRDEAETQDGRRQAHESGSLARSD